MFGLQSQLDPMVLIILGVLVLCLVVLGVYAARRRPALRATVQDEALAPWPAGTAPPAPNFSMYADPNQNPYYSQPVAPPPVAPPPPQPAPVVQAALAQAASYNAETGTMTGPFPLPPVDMPLQDSRLVAPTEVVLLWRTVSRDVEEYSVRIDTVSHDQLVFGGLVHNPRAPQPGGALERRLFHTMVLPDESMLSIRTRAGTPIKNVRAWLRGLPDAQEAHIP